MRILVVGTGGVGGYFGGRLLASNRDVTFLVRPARAAQLARTGLSIQSPTGNVHLAAPPTVTTDLIDRPFDLVLLSCKAQDLADAMESFAPAIGLDTAILPLLNGMGHLDSLNVRFGKEHVLGGTCFISAVRNEDGQIVHLNDTHTLTFGECDGTAAQRIENVSVALADAGFDARHSQTILRDMWAKWIFIATGAGMTCLMRATLGDIVAAGAGDLSTRFFGECAEIAAAEGYPASGDAVQRSRTMFTQPGSLFTASMLRDIEAGAPVEADQIIGDLLQRGKAHGLATPLLRIAFAHLRTYEERRMRERTT